LDEVDSDLVDSEMHLRDQGEKLTLLDPLSNIIDETPDAGPGDGSWAAGQAGSNGQDEPWRSMERDDDGEGWHSSCVNSGTYWDDEEGEDYGTPRGENSADDCEIEEETTGGISAPLLELLPLSTTTPTDTECSLLQDPLECILVDPIEDGSDDSVVSGGEETTPEILPGDEAISTGGTEQTDPGII
jgi:hypothetical protein